MPALSSIMAPLIELNACGGPLSSTTGDALCYLYPPGATSTLLKQTLGSHAIARHASIDASTHAAVKLVHAEDVPGSRLILAPTGPLDRDFDDVRRYGNAARAGVRMARNAGARAPLLVVVLPGQEDSSVDDFKHAAEVAVLGALQELYVPLEAREWLVKKDQPASTVTSLSIAVTNTSGKYLEASVVNDILVHIRAIEQGRIIARDITESDPERMSAVNAAAYVQQQLGSLPNVTVRVEQDFAVLKREYPLLHAVARASLENERHRPAVVTIEYRSPVQADVKENLFFVGKGINYDTGGADLKTGGHMRGMSRDKGGAGGVAGFLRTVAALQPRHVNVTAKLAFVHNSIGAQSYVSDEIIVSRTGVRVLIGNTDAEGRMVMADLLAECKERALELQQEQHACRLFTVATLTGHVIRAYGMYPACMDNGPARKLNMSRSLADTGAAHGEPWEVSILRHDDYAMVAATSEREDVVQCNTTPSTMTARGHQFAPCFMMIAAGLDKCALDQKDTKKRIAYTHCDIAGAAEESGSASGSLARTTGAPVITFTAQFLRGDQL